MARVIKIKLFSHVYKKREHFPFYTGKRNTEHFQTLSCKKNKNRFLVDLKDFMVCCNPFQIAVLFNEKVKRFFKLSKYHSRFFDKKQEIFFILERYGSL